MAINIGVLSFQGSVIEHMKMLEKTSGARGTEVKTVEALNKVDAMILPGGESTCIAKLLVRFGMLEPLKKRIMDGMPVWGTCAGLILLAKTIENEPAHLGVMDIVIKRNAYGNQLDSFITESVVAEISSEPIPLVFIRAPWIDSVSADARVLAEYNGHIIAARQKNMLATSFHPELTDDISAHKYFVNMALESAEKR